LANALRNAGHFDEAVATYDHALAVVAEALRPNHPRLANYELALGTAYYQHGDDAQAEVHYRRGFEIRLANHGARSELTAAARLHLALVHVRQGRAEEALPELREVLAVREENLAANDMRIADSLTALAQALDALGRPADALPLLRRARTIQSSPIVEGTDDRPSDPESLAATHLELARALWAQRAASEARREASEARAVLEHARPCTAGLRRAVEAWLAERGR
jgi:tetratricopeptide (TPR) repeat protein